MVLLMLTPQRLVYPPNVKMSVVPYSGTAGRVPRTRRPSYKFVRSSSRSVLSPHLVSLARRPSPRTVGSVFRCVLGGAQHDQAMTFGPMGFLGGSTGSIGLFLPFWLTGPPRSWSMTGTM